MPNTLKSNTTINLKSNIALKSSFIDKPDHYLPVELMRKEYLDTRNEINWTVQQSLDVTKHLFWAKNVKDIYEEQDPNM